MSKSKSVPINTARDYPHPNQIGIIDIGSHSIRLEIFQTNPRQPREFELFESISREINLGEAVFRNGSVNGDVLNQCCEIMRSFADKLTEYAIPCRRAIATSAIREATNRDLVLDRIKNESGITVEVLESQEEGRLLYSATSDLLKKNHLFPSKQALFFFIGTGSLIVMFTNHGRLQFSECSAFGSIRILDEFGGMGIRPQRMADLLKSMELKERLAHMANFDCHSPVEVIGVGAGLRSGEMLAEFTRCGNGQVRFLETTSFDELCRTLKSFTPLELEEKLNIVDHLAVNMVSSFAIAEYFVNEFSASRLLLPWLSTRSALVTNLLNPELEQEFRNDLLSAVENIGDKYNFDRRHAALVTNVAMKIFDKLKVHFQLNERDRIILECGAMLHDVGRFVDIRQHHKHSFYLISNSNLPGLSGRDLHLVAAIARYHRKSAPKNGQIEFDRCSVADRVVLQKLAAILRVADSLVRGETDKYLKLSIHLIDGALVFRNPGSVDTLLESVYLAKKGDLFREVFGLKLKFEEDLKRS